MRAIIVLGWESRSNDAVPQIVYSGLDADEARAAIASSGLPFITTPIRNPQLQDGVAVKTYEAAPPPREVELTRDARPSRPNRPRPRQTRTKNQGL